MGQQLCVSEEELAEDRSWKGQLGRAVGECSAMHKWKRRCKKESEGWRMYEGPVLMKRVKGDP